MSSSSVITRAASSKLAVYRCPSVSMTPVLVAGSNPMERTAIVNGPPGGTFSKLNRPAFEVAVASRRPVAVLVIETTAPSSGAPPSLVTMPVTAELVMPWADN